VSQEFDSEMTERYLLAVYAVSISEYFTLEVVGTVGLGATVPVLVVVDTDPLTVAGIVDHTTLGSAIQVRLTPGNIFLPVFVT
jgi:hypothetical protein